MYNEKYWQALEELVNTSKIIIDRPKGSRHPRYSDIVYEIDYGNLVGTSGGDGDGIDVWVGSKGEKKIDAIMSTVDLMKRDTEIKILIGCTDDEMKIIYEFHNHLEPIAGILIRRK